MLQYCKMDTAIVCNTDAMPQRKLEKNVSKTLFVHQLSTKKYRLFVHQLSTKEYRLSSSIDLNGSATTTIPTHFI